MSLRTITSHVSLSSGGYGEIEFAITPLDYEPDLRIAGGDANLTLVLTDAAGNLTDSSPVNYKLVNVAKVVSSDGESMPGRYKATVQDYYKSTSYKEYASLVLSVDDYNGLSGRAVSGPVEISYGSDAALYSVEVGGVSALKGDDGVFYVKLPAGKNVSSMPVKFAFGGALLEVLEPDGSYRQSDKTDNLDMTAPVTLRVTTVDGVQNEYKLIGCYSNLPVVYITTPQPVMSKDNWVKNCVMEIWHAGEHNGRYETSVKGRGNSTWGMPKKPYAIKLDKKAKVLGMPKHKRWVLLANWKDRTLLRNDVAFEIARQLPALDWTPRGDFVDVVMNGKFAGNYYLGEQIKVDENRVPVTEMESANIAGNDITGGYLLELDIHYDEVNKFRTPYKDFPVNFKSPDEDVLVPAQFDYVKNYFAEMEEILYGENADNKD
ncbi:MAG: CotH kinase family protein, partial [Muribaculaceae bacterium]|nr:CotH kinase family protein [Muribaculaceae bacterium]